MDTSKEMWQAKGILIVQREAINPWIQGHATNVHTMKLFEAGP